MAQAAVAISAEDRVSAAKIQLIKEQPFWATVLLSLNMVEDRTLPIMGTNGIDLFYNPDGLDKLGSLQNIKYVMCHEVLHVVMEHFSRGRIKIHGAWNIAADIIVNYLLDHNNMRFDPKATQNTEMNILNEQYARNMGITNFDYDNHAVNEMYEEVLKRMQRKGGGCTCGQEQAQGKGGKGKGQGQPQQGQGQSQQGQGQGDTVDPMCPEHGDGGGFDTHRYKHLEEHEKTMVKHAVVKGLQMARQQGVMPYGLQRLFDKILDPQVDWWVKLRRILKERAGGYTETRLYPNKKSHALGIFQPTYSGYKHKDVVAAIDTSGSIGDPELRRFASEIVGIAKLARKTYVMTCDAQVHEFIEIKNHAPLDIVKKCKFKGGGGTDFRPVFKEIKKRKLRPKILVYLTDTYGTFPDKQPKDIHVIWCVIDQAGKVPWGEMIHVTPAGKER